MQHRLIVNNTRSAKSGTLRSVASRRVRQAHRACPLVLWASARTRLLLANDTAASVRARAFARPNGGFALICGAGDLTGFGCLALHDLLLHS